MDNLKGIPQKPVQRWAEEEEGCIDTVYEQICGMALPPTPQLLT